MAIRISLLKLPNAKDSAPQKFEVDGLWERE